MAHEKVYGICENKCKVEVYAKTQADAKFSDVNTQIANTNNAVAAAQSTANTAVTNAATAQGTANDAIDLGSTANTTAINANDLATRNAGRLDDNKGIFNNCYTTLASDLNTIKAATTVSALNEAMQATITHIQNVFAGVK